MSRKSHSGILLAGLSLLFVLVGGGGTAVAADLAIEKADSPDPVSVGSTLTYTILVRNLGPDTVTDVTVTDRIPQGTDFVSVTTSSGQCARKGRGITCGLGTIGPPSIDYAGPRTITLSVIPRRVGTITNTASVRGKQKQKDPVSSNDKATATTLVVGPPATCRGVPATPGDDVIVGTGGPDVIAAFGGNDRIVSLTGRDLICAGRGSDHVGSGRAADRVFGGAGGDRLLGRGGPDLLRGGAGADVLGGNAGADRLRGGSGFDRCRGGAGADSVRGCER